MVVRKPFDRELFERNDALARSTVLLWLDDNGPAGWLPNPDKFGVDLIRYRSEDTKHPRPILMGIEVEIKAVWSGPKLAWDTVQLPERKAKFSKLPYPVEFWILNKERSHALVFPSRLLSELDPVEVRNKYVAAGEKFYQIPVSMCRMVTL